jgi:hypothetical protein
MKKHDRFISNFAKQHSKKAIFPELGLSCLFMDFPFFVKEKDPPHLKSHFPSKDQLSNKF